MSSFEIHSFVEGLKKAGVLISNEKDLVKRVSAANDPVRELCRHFKNSHTLGVSFSVDPRREAKDLVQLFKDSGLDDGWSYHDFLSNAKLIGD